MNQIGLLYQAWYSDSSVLAGETQLRGLSDLFYGASVCLARLKTAVKERLGLS